MSTNHSELMNKQAVLSSADIQVMCLTVLIMVIEMVWLLAVVAPREKEANQLYQTIHRVSSVTETQNPVTPKKSGTQMEISKESSQDLAALKKAGIEEVVCTPNPKTTAECSFKRKDNDLWMTFKIRNMNLETPIFIKTGETNNSQEIRLLGKEKTKSEDPTKLAQSIKALSLIASWDKEISMRL